MLSVVINTYNEEKNIADCIKSVKSIASEVVVCDMYSEDDTVKIAESLGATILMHKKEKVVEPARYAAIASATQPWVLVLDADERMTEITANRIFEAIRKPYDLIYMWSKNFYFGDYVENGGFYYEVPRCFKKDLYMSSYNDDELKTHMNFSSIQNFCTSPLHLSKDYFYHHLAYPSIEKYISKTLGYYARVEAVDRMKDGHKFSKTNLLFGPFKTFIKKYIFLKGYKDGVRGLILCMFYSMYEFARWANIWLLEQTPKTDCTKPGMITPKQGISFATTVSGQEADTGLRKSALP